MTLLLTLINRESVCIVDRDHRKHAIMVEIPKASSAIGRDMGPIKVLHTTKEEHFKESIFPSFFVFVSFQISNKSGVAKNKIELVVSCTSHNKVDTHIGVGDALSDSIQCLPKTVQNRQKGGAFSSLIQHVDYGGCYLDLNLRFCTTCRFQDLSGPSPLIKI